MNGSQLRLPAGYRLVCRDSIGSTNDEAKGLARRGAPEGTLLILNPSEYDLFEGSQTDASVPHAFRSDGAGEIICSTRGLRSSAAAFRTEWRVGRLF